jgi:mono/diheme cytochrome c family protein
MNLLRFFFAVTVFYSAVCPGVDGEPAALSPGGARIGAVGPRQNENDAARPLLVVSQGGQDASADRLPEIPIASPIVQQGRNFYEMSCAQCHGDEAQGNEGPSLHHLHLSDARIAAVIKNGVKEKMPAYAKRYDDRQVEALVIYLRNMR